MCVTSLINQSIEFAPRPCLLHLGYTLLVNSASEKGNQTITIGTKIKDTILTAKTLPLKPVGIAEPTIYTATDPGVDIIERYTT